MQYSKESSEFFQLKVRGAELSGFFFSLMPLNINIFKFVRKSLVESLIILIRIHSHIQVSSILFGSPQEQLLFPCMVEFTRVDHLCYHFDLYHIWIN